MERDLFIIFYLFTVSVARSEEFFNTSQEPINSNFSCTGRLTGYYADLPSNCRIYHNCDDQGNKFSYHCPEMTAFRQEALICDHAYLVDCQAGNRLLTEVKKPSNTSEQSPAANRWTTGSPFRDYLLGKDSGINVGSRKPGWPADVSFKNPESHSAFFRLDTTDSSHTRSSTSGKDFPPKRIETSRNDWRQTIPQRQLEAPFAGTLFRKHTNRNDGDNGGTKYRTEERRDEESTTTQCVCKDVKQPTEAHFTLPKTVYSGYGKVGSRSVQTSSRPSPTTPMTPLTSETPFRDFTASLKPLVPNALEYDPYYPKEPWTTTETYYTPSEKEKIPRAFDSPNFQPPLVGIYFKIPDVLPDLNTLDDIVDRRRLFYIPKTNKL